MWIITRGTPGTVSFEDYGVHVKLESIDLIKDYGVCFMYI